MKLLRENTTYSWQRLLSLPILAGLVCLAVIIGGVWWHAASQSTANDGHGSSKKQATSQSSAQKPMASTENSKSGQDVNAGVASSASSSAAASNKACGMLTLDSAKVLIGQDASQSASGSTAADIDTITCTYTAGAHRIVFTIHAAKTDLGKSDNALHFGSEKPSGVTDVQGYGQAAYWDAGKTELHVLKDNDWYSIGLQDGAGLEAARAVADSLNPKL
jgi:cytoskeletal protein RodZ